MTKDLNAGGQFNTCPKEDSVSSTSTAVTSSAATSTAPPSDSSSSSAVESSSSSTAESSGLSTGATTGIAVGAVAVGLGAITGLIFFLIRRRKRSKKNRVLAPIDGHWENSSQEIINPYMLNDASVGMGDLCKWKFSYIDSTHVDLSRPQHWRLIVENQVTVLNLPHHKHKLVLALVSFWLQSTNATCVNQTQHGPVRKITVLRRVARPQQYPDHPHTPHHHHAQVQVQQVGVERPHIQYQFDMLMLDLLSL